MSNLLAITVKKVCRMPHWDKVLQVWFLGLLPIVFELITDFYFKVADRLVLVAVLKSISIFIAALIIPIIVNNNKRINVSSTKRTWLIIEYTSLILGFACLHILTMTTSDMNWVIAGCIGVSVLTLVVVKEQHWMYENFHKAETEEGQETINKTKEALFSGH